MSSSAHNEERLRAEVEALRAQVRRLEKSSSQATLQESQQRLHGILATAPVIVFALDSDGIFTFVEGRGLAAFDRQTGGPVGHSIFEVCKDVPDVHEKVRQVLAGQNVTGVLNVEKAIFEMRFTPARDADGQVNGAIGVALDITEHLKAKEALAASEARFKNLLDTLPYGVEEINTEGIITFCNRSYEQMNGYEPGELLGMPIWERLDSQEEKGQLRKLLARLVREQPEPTSYVTHNRRKDGSAIDVEIIWNYRRNQAGEVIGFLGVVVDVTERTKIQQQLHLLARAVEQITEGIAVVNPQGKLLFLNRAFAAVHGYSPEELVGKHLSIFHAPEQMAAVEMALEQCRRTGTYEGEVWHARRDGSVFLTHMYVLLLRDETNQPIGLIGTLRDITEQKKTEEEKSRLESQLYQVQKLEAIGQLAGGVAHDFNNLLAVIMGNASIMRRDTSLPDKTREALADILTAAERGSAMTQQLLAYARGGLQEPIPTDINRLIRSVLPMLERTAPAKLTFENQLAEDLPEILADPPRIEQIVMNLCLNAIQASHPPAKVILRTTVDELDKTLAADLQLTPGRYVLFQVIDEGVGIDPAIRKRIFEPFFTTKEMGRGMGLAVTHGIIQSHRGQIRTASEVEKGTTVSVWLPAAIPTRDSEQESKTTVKPKRPPRGSETVLVIDDESAVTNTIEQILSSLGYCVVSYTDADRAIAFLDTNAEDVDLMLCDLNMPKHNGREMAQRVARQFSHIAVLLISGVDESELRAQIPPEQKVDFLAKPFTMMTLAETVRETLDKQAPSSPSTPQ